MKKASNPLEPAVNALSKFGKAFMVHQKFIYFVLFACALIGAILGLNLALNPLSDDAYRSTKMSQTQSPRFDTGTIQKIQNLNARQQTITEPVPAGKRTNPFGE